MNAEAAARKQRAFDLFEEGRDYREVARETGVQAVVAFNWHREWERKRPAWTAEPPEPPAIEHRDPEPAQGAGATAPDPEASAPPIEQPQAWEPPVPLERMDEAQLRHIITWDESTPQMREAGRVELARREQAERAARQAARQAATMAVRVGEIRTVRVTRLETYGAFCELLDEDGNSTGCRGLLHRSKIFALGTAPRRSWVPEEFLQVGDLIRAAVVDAAGPYRLEFSTAQQGTGQLSRDGRTEEQAERPRPPRQEVPPPVLKPAPPPEPDPEPPGEHRPERGDLLRLRGIQCPAVVIPALEAALAALRRMDPEEQVSVHIEVRR